MTTVISVRLENLRTHQYTSHITVAIWPVIGSGATQQVCVSVRGPLANMSANLPFPYRCGCFITCSNCQRGRIPVHWLVLDAQDVHGFMARIWAAMSLNYFCRIGIHGLFVPSVYSALRIKQFIGLSEAAVGHSPSRGYHTIHFIELHVCRLVGMQHVV